MATFVLVPGAWLGGWCWKYVAPELRATGHEVYTPTLTGLGERVHLARPEVDLDTHVTDIVNVLEFEEIEDAVLVGHSYAGLVVTEVANRVSDRLSHVFYLDGMVPMDDQPASLFDFGGPDYRALIEAEANERGDGWRWPMPNEHEGWVGIPDADARWMRSKAVPQPVATLDELVSVGESATALPHTYVLCTANGTDEPVQNAIRGMATEREWNLDEIDTGHWPMVSTPGEVVQSLLEIP